MPETPEPKKSRKSTATHFLLRGLAICLPPILTLVILIWIASVANQYVMLPMTNLVRFSIASVKHEIRHEDDLVRVEGQPSLLNWDTRYRVTPGLNTKIAKSDNLDENQIKKQLLASSHEVYVPMGGGYVPLDVYRVVESRVGVKAMPATAMGVYMEYAAEYFWGVWHLSALALALTVVLLYFIGRLVTARLGAWAVHKVETVFLSRLPVVRNVYSSVKQVTDFLLTEREVEYRRVVAIEYPRRGIWSLGLVTGDSMLGIVAATGEPMVSVLIPSSPMPVTGYTMNVPRSELIDLNISIDQAFQFCISCGVLVPPNQTVTPELLQEALRKRLPSAALSDSDVESPAGKPL